MPVKKNKDMNAIIGTVVITFLWIIFAALIVSSIIMWQKSNDFIAITSGIFGALGILFNIFLMSREKKIKQG